MEIKYSRDIDKNIIQDLIDIESMVYEKKYCGTYPTIEARYKKNNDTFVLAYDEGRMVGYLCFLPISDSLYRDIVETDQFHDDDISPEDVIQFHNHVNLYLVSIAILPSYQNTAVIVEMTKAFFRFLKEKREQNICVSNILASAVTEDGVKFLQRLGFQKLKTVDEQYSLFILNYDEEWTRFEKYTG